MTNGKTENNRLRFAKYTFLVVLKTITRFKIIGMGILALALSLGAGAGVATAAPIPLTTCGTITVSGSYQLQNNLTGPLTAGNCLVLTGAAQANTTIDLAGWTITGNSTSTVAPGNGTGAGISNTSVVEGLTIFNGTIKGFATGISIFGNHILVERMILLRNSAAGLTGVEAVHIKDSYAEGNLVGASVSEGAVVTGSSFSFNTGDGLKVGAAGVSPGSTISNNTAIRNGGAGLRVKCPALILGNTFNGNAGGNVVRQGDGCVLAHNAIGSEDDD